MPRILLAISADIYVRNYLRTDALSSLQRKYDLDIIADTNLALAAEVEKHPLFAGFFSLAPDTERKHHLLFNLLMWRHRKKSRTFLYRWLRNSQWHLIKRQGSLLERTLSLVSWFVKASRNPHGLRIPVLASAPLFPLISAVLRKSLPVNPDLEKYVRSNHYDMIMFPSAAFDSLSVDLARLGQKYNVPTLCLIDNWDNLTSKTVFWKKPDFLGVWGEQARQQAMSVHGFLAEQIHLLGTPRFDSYFATREAREEKRHYEFPYLLFVGSAMPFDEIGTLHALDRILESDHSIPANLRIVYRPHPWQQKRNSPAVFDSRDFSRVDLDLQIKAAFDAGLEPEKTDPAFQPDLGYYPSLLRGAEAVIGPLTTMLFEASLCLRPVIALSYFDNYHPNTGKRYFVHFEGMEKVPGFTFCNGASELYGHLKSALEHEAIRAKASDTRTSYFLFRDHLSYPDRLAQISTSVLESEKRATRASKP
jgi:hypothetical protein